MKDVDHESTAQLLRSVLALGRRLRAARATNGRPPRGLTILGALYRRGPLLASQLAAEEQLQPQSLTRVLSELERDRLISRRRSEQDGRAQIITLTALGRSRLLEEIGARREWLKAAMAAALSAEEREVARRAADVLLKLAGHEAVDLPSFTKASPKKSGHAFVDDNLVAAEFRNVNLEKAVFNDVNLRTATFENVSLAAATFSDVNLSKVAIRNANVRGMTINGDPVQRDEIASSATVFHVSQLPKALDFYVRILGFAIDFRYGAPETYAGLSWRGVHLHLSSSYPYKNNTGHGSLYIRCDDVDRLYGQFDSAGVDFYSRIAERPYGMRDFAIRDPDGNQLGFGVAS